MKSIISTFFLVALFAFVSIGCSGTEARLEAPKMDAEKMTESAFELCDANGDGELSASELGKAPGLKFAAKDLDTDGNKQLSRAEVLERFQLYVDQKVGLQGISCKVLRNGVPLDGGEVTLEPEPFMADFIGPTTGKVIDPDSGLVEFLNEEQLPGVNIGMYKVRITSPNVKISSKFNENTTLGIEVAPVTNSSSGGILFKVN